MLQRNILNLKITWPKQHFMIISTHGIYFYTLPSQLVFLPVTGPQVKYHIIRMYQQITEILVFSVLQKGFTPNSAYTASTQSLCTT